MQLKMRNIEWWMRKRHLPVGLRARVRNYEHQHWAAMHGVDECEMIRNLPESLRRDIKYHLCLDLVRKVPLFQHMDDLDLVIVCDRVKSLIITKGETITREGDPVQRMLFVVSPPPFHRAPPTLVLNARDARNHGGFRARG
ncbi:hypothetical protein TIFTF001_041315 [Ficus carica]|uniref:Cyclic nucleotide-binding domain-containing protein n=1 Tax=Ficus carica TaxID=3494 RepID=A0AA88CTC7_FICCA|nr:hypothetical protein TIFTF001_041315 [Ficus carica]